MYARLARVPRLLVLLALAVVVASLLAPAPAVAGGPLTIFSLNCAQVIPGAGMYAGDFSCTGYVAGGTGSYTYTWTTRSYNYQRNIYIWTQSDTADSSSVYGACDWEARYRVTLHATDSSGMTVSKNYDYLYCTLDW